VIAGGHLDPSVEQGKRAIVAHVQRVMVRHGLDVAELVFSWDREFIGSYWDLRVHDGVKRRKIRFLNDEIMQWERWPELVPRYAPKILALIDRIRGKRW
jgi:hypothetical protein